MLKLSSMFSFKCIYSLRQFQRTLRFVASFYIDKDIAKTKPVRRFRVKDSHNYIVYVNTVNLLKLATIFSVR